MCFSFQVAKLVLINTSVAASITYVMQSTLIPQHTILELERIHCRFFWGEHDQTRKIHSVACSRIYHLREEGGLSIPNLRQLNIAYMAKFGWRLIQQQALWSMILKGKYGDVRSFSAYVVPPSSSYT